MNSPNFRKIFEKIKISFPSDPVDTLSMGMSSDYLFAMENGSTMVRIGSLHFWRGKDENSLLLVNFAPCNIISHGRK